MHKVLYLGLDAHARLCVLALMDASGRVIGTEAFSTSEAALVQAVSNAPARIKYLAVEESALAGWIANALRPHVDELIVCDRRHNALISRSGHKDDYADAIKLCRLHRMGELKSVYPTDDSDRVDFKIAVQQYLALRCDAARLKTQIKAKYHQAGVVNVTGTQVFGKTERERYLEQVPSKARRQSIGICTRHLPDAVVTMFRPDDQSLGGIEGIVKQVRGEKQTLRRSVPIQLHFVMAAVPNVDDEEGILERHRTTFEQRLNIPSGQLLEIRHYQSMDLLTHPIYTDIRPRTKLATSFKELARRIRALNIEDRSGILDYLQSATPVVPEQGKGDFFVQIRQEFGSDPEILAELARVYGSRGSILEEAALLERVASLGSPTPSQWIKIAHVRRLTHDEESVLEALESFFRQPKDPSSDQAEVGHRLVQIGLDLLESTGVDRVPYVKDSPLMKGLSLSSRASVASQLNLTGDEQKVAVKILEEVLATSDGSPELKADSAFNLAFAYMAVGDFTPAIDYYQSELAKPVPYAGLQAAFNLAMALWAVHGEAEPDAFTRVLEYLDAGSDTSWLADNPNNLQALAVAEWFARHPDKACSRLNAAEQAIGVRRTEVSCWSYTRVPRKEFHDHCREIRTLFAGNEVRPLFMRVVEP